MTFVQAWQNGLLLPKIVIVLFITCPIWLTYVLAKLDKAIK